MTGLNERVARLEAMAESQDEKTDRLEVNVAALSAKADQIIAYAQWGRGAVWAVLKVAGFLSAIGVAIAWLYDRLAIGGPHP